VRRLRYDQDVRALPLLLALQAAGVPVRQVLPWAGYAEVEVEDGADEATIAAVVAAHDPAAIDAAAAAEQQQDSGDLGKVRAAYQTLRANVDALRADAAAMPATLTAAQVRARLIQLEGALADVSDATASLARYVGRRLG
jgi:hypothetical protein